LLNNSIIRTEQSLIELRALVHFTVRLEGSVRQKAIELKQLESTAFFVRMRHISCRLLIIPQNLLHDSSVLFVRTFLCNQAFRAWRSFAYGAGTKKVLVKQQN